eukprot:g1809.t1
MKCFADLLGTTKAPLWRKSPRGEAELNEQARHADEKDGLVEGGAKYKHDLKYYPPSYEHVQQDWKMVGAPDEESEVVSEAPGGVEVQQRRGVFETQMSKFLQARGFDENGADAGASTKDEETSTTTITSTPMREPHQQGTATETERTQKNKKKYTDGLDNDFFWRSLLTKTSPEDAPRAGIHPSGSGTGINFHVQNNGIHALDFERPTHKRPASSWAFPILLHILRRGMLVVGGAKFLKLTELLMRVREVPLRHDDHLHVRRAEAHSSCGRDWDWERRAHILLHASSPISK